MRFYRKLTQVIHTIQTINKSFTDIRIRLRLLIRHTNERGHLIYANKLIIIFNFINRVKKGTIKMI